MRIFIFFLLLLLIPPQNAYAKECVILLHGLARTDSSMSEMKTKLETEDYIVVNNSYPSRTDTIDNLADKAIDKAIKECPEGSKINFVTHSMGGILIRQYLSLYVIENMGRVVMLGPPNKGSQVVDKLHDVPGFELINGPAGMQLGTGKASVPNSLGAASFDLGIIAGTRSINLILSTILPDKDDGKVSVENTKIEGMNDHIEMPVTHTFMMSNDKVIKQVIEFLKNGAFEKKKEMP